MLAVDAQRFTAGRNDGGPGTAADDRVGQLGHRFDDMLAALTESTALLEKTVATQPIEAAYLNAPLHDQYVQICQIRLQQNRPDDMLSYKQFDVRKKAGITKAMKQST